MTLFGGPSSFCLSSSYVYDVVLIVVLVYLEGLDSPVVYFLELGCLVSDLQWLV